MAPPSSRRPKTWRSSLRAVTALGVLLLCSAAPSEAASLRLESAFGYDSNVRHDEGTEVLGDSLARIILHVTEAQRLRKLRLLGSYHGGARRFTDTPGEDALFQRAQASAALGFTKWLGLSLGGNLSDRSTRDPETPRDHTLASAHAGPTFRFAGFVLGLSATGERLHHKTSERFSSTGVGGRGSLSRRLGAFRLRLAGDYKRRTFEGPPLVEVGRVDGVPVAEEGEGKRRDESLLGSLSSHYTGVVVASATYSLLRNRSESVYSAYLRHSLEASITADLGWSLLFSARAQLQRLIHDESRQIAEGNESERAPDAAGQIVQDESRTGLTLRLERPVYGDLSLVGHAGFWFSPLGSGVDYDRQLFALGVAYSR